MTRDEMRDVVWLCLVVLASVCGGWFGHAPSPVAIFAVTAAGVLAGTWYVAGRDGRR